MDKIGAGCWVIAEIENGITTLVEFTGFTDNRATTLMRKKYGKYGKYIEARGEIVVGDDDDDHYYTLLWLPIDLDIALWVDIKMNQFEVGANIPGLKCKMYYLDAEYSKTKRSKVFRLDEPAIAEMTELIKKEEEKK